ncbi:unnamed protein product [Ectocarpus sp. CCAP 1310/34]|nr:unnamed protein product [Ectocarpus sp. CCAP 1310/34]
MGGQFKLLSLQDTDVKPQAGATEPRVTARGSVPVNQEQEEVVSQTEQVVTVKEEQESESVTIQPLTSREKQKIMTGYVTMNMKDWTKLPWIPLSDSPGELVSFNRRLEDTVNDVFLAVGDYNGWWAPGWEKPVHGHLITSITRSMSPAQTMTFREKIDKVFADTSKKMEEGSTGKKALAFLTSALGRVVVSSSPEKLQTFAVPTGTPYSEYLTTLQGLVHNVRNLGVVTPQDNTIQLAVRESVPDQCSVLTASVFKGMELGVVPFDNIDTLMHELRNVEAVKGGATTPTRRIAQVKSSSGWRQGQRGGGGGRKGSGGTNTFRSASPGRSDCGYGGRVMTVEDMDYEDECAEFKRVYDIHAAPRTNSQANDCPFLAWFTSVEEKDRHRRVFGLRCLNCGSEGHFVRDCDMGYINASNMLNKNLANGSKAEVKARWDRWLHRLRQWQANRMEERRKERNN